MSHPRDLALVLVTALLAPVVAQASMEQIPIERLVRDAEVIVVGRVVSSNSAFTVDGNRIDTLVTVETDRTLKGQPGPIFDVRIEGGRVGDTRMWVEDEPVLGADETVVLFLVRDGSHFRALGKFQGKFEIRDDTVYGAARVPVGLGEFESRVQKILGGGR